MNPRQPRRVPLGKLVPKHKILPPLPAAAIAEEAHARSVLAAGEYARIEETLLGKKHALASKNKPLTLTRALEEGLRITNDPAKVLNVLRSLAAKGGILEAPQAQAQKTQLTFETKLHPLCAKLEEEYFRLAKIYNPNNHPELVNGIMQQAIVQILQRLKE